MLIRDYIDAAYEALEKSGADHVLTRLKDHLSTRGLTKLYPRILRGIIEKEKRKRTSTVPRIIVAREKDLARYKEEIASALKKVGGEKHEVLTDASIIGGFIVKGKNERIDHSYKRSLLQAYHRLTNKV